MKEISWKRFGYHVVYDKDIYDAIDFAGKNGFGYIVPDLMIPRFFPERFSKAERQHIREAAASKNVSISFHGPSDYLNLATLYPEVRLATLERLKKSLQFARDVGAERFTIHVEPPFDFVFAGREGTFLRDNWTAYKNAMKLALIELSEYTGDTLLCVENNRLGKMAIEVLQELLPAKRLFLTWDLPKSHTKNGEPIIEIEDFLMRNIDKVKECHLHDQKPREYSHDAIGVGTIDFTRYLKILLPYDIQFTLEIRPREDALRSLETLKIILARIGWEISSHTW